MSKQLGNSPDPLDLIAKYGADGVRVGMLLSAPAGNDLLFDEGLCQQGRNFANKIWNAFRLVKGLEVDDKLPQPSSSALAVRWFESKFSSMLNEINSSYDQFRISEALMTTYKLIWDEFCSWYLEIVKPAYGEAIDAKTYNQTIEFFDKIARVVHPFMPFISEELWHLFDSRSDGDTIMKESWPVDTTIDSELIDSIELQKEIITAIRSFRKEKNIPVKDGLDLLITGKSGDIGSDSDIVKKLANLNRLEKSDSKPGSGHSFMVRTVELFIPYEEEIDKDEMSQKIQEELKYTKGFLNSIEKKLGNARFVENAPDKVVDLERKKKDDALKKIEALERQLKELSQHSV